MEDRRYEMLEMSYLLELGFFADSATKTLFKCLLLEKLSEKDIRILNEIAQFFKKAREGHQQVKSTTLSGSDVIHSIAAYNRVMHAIPLLGREKRKAEEALLEFDEISAKLINREHVEKVKIRKLQSFFRMIGQGTLDEATEHLEKEKHLEVSRWTPMKV